MTHFTSYIEGFLSGVVFGVICMIGLIGYIYQIKLQTTNDEDTKETEENSLYHPDREGDINSEELVLIQEAVAYLEGLNGTFQTISQNPDTFGFAGTPEKNQKIGENSNGNSNNTNTATTTIVSKYIGGDLDEMEADFNTCMKELKDKIRNCRSLSSLSHDLGKACLSFAKDLNKLSTVAYHNTIQGSISLAQTSLFGASEIENDNLSDRLWATLAKTIEFIASEYDSLADKLSNNVADKLTTLSDDLVVAEKHLSGEGSKRLSLVRDTIQQRDKHLKDRDRRRDKVNANAEKGQASIIAGLGMKDVMEKLSNSEQTLSDSNNRVINAIKDINKSLPKIIQDSLTFSARSIVMTRFSLVTIGSSMKTINSRTIGLTEDFHRTIESVTNQAIYSRKSLRSSSTIPPPSNSAAAAVKRSNELRDIIFGIMSKMIDVENNKSLSVNASSANANINTNTNTTGSPERTTTSGNAVINDNITSKLKLNMSSEASSSLAASPPLKFLAQLPPSFASTIQHETGVWFNAFSGRIYRDIARSDYFHAWFCSKLAFILNKGNRPGFVDEFRVDNVAFGSTPPILTNILWTPLFDTKKSGRGSGTASAPPSTSGLKGSKGEKSFTSGKQDPSYLGNLDDPDNDVVCHGDLSFKSGIQFSLSTRIWCNWPRDHYVSIPITMKLEIREVSGPIKFGVRRNCSFVSFLEEPQTRFKISVEVGSQIKIKDIPLVSDYVETKLRKLIRKRFVYPNAHKARLLWPRSWWPAGTETEFLPTGPTIDSVSIPQKPTSESVSPVLSTSNEENNSGRKLSKSKFPWLGKSSDAPKQQTDITESNVISQLNKTDDDSNGNNNSGNGNTIISQIHSSPPPSSSSSSSFVPESTSSPTTDSNNVTGKVNEETLRMSDVKSREGEDDDDEPEVVLERELKGVDYEPEYISTAETVNHGLGPASITIRMKPDGSPYDFDDDEDDGESSPDERGLHSPSSPRVMTTITVSGVSVSPPPKSSTIVQATIATSLPSNTSTTSVSATTSTNTNISQQQSSSSSAWLSNLAHKTKTKFSEFKEKHLRGTSDESSGSSSLTTSSSTSHGVEDLIFRDNDNSNSNNSNSNDNTFTMINPRNRTNTIDGSNRLETSHDAPTSYIRNRTNSIDRNQVLEGMSTTTSTMKQRYLSPDNDDYNHGYDRDSGNPGTNPGDVNRMNSSKSPINSSTNHLSSITRRLQQAKEVIRNEVNKHVDSRRNSTGATSTIVSPRSSIPTLKSFTTDTNTNTTMNTKAKPIDDPHQMVLPP